MRRRTTCDGIRDTVAASIAVEDRLADDTVAGHLVLALDIWRGADFTERNRSTGWSWVPFVSADDTPDTDETRAARLTRTYGLDGAEKEALTEMRKDPIGQIAFVAGLVAARIHAYPAWELSFFDERNVRVDLAAEVRATATSAVGLRDQRELLGRPPIGHLRADADVVGVYIEKARVLDRRADGLVERLQAFADYRAVVAGIQRREDKRHWFERVGGIDDFEHAVDDVVTRSEVERIRRVAGDSETLAELYLDSLAPLTASLTVAGMTR